MPAISASRHGHHPTVLVRKRTLITGREWPHLVPCNKELFTSVSLLQLLGPLGHLGFVPLLVQLSRVDSNRQTDDFDKCGV